jgi:hypothetical protein
LLIRDKVLRVRAELDLVVGLSGWRPALLIEDELLNGGKLGGEMPAAHWYSKTGLSRHWKQQSVLRWPFGDGLEHNNINTALSARLNFTSSEINKD